MTMVFIPGGEVKMGVDEGPIDVKPAHQVKSTALDGPTK
jgi:hypothetical protein